MTLPPMATPHDRELGVRCGRAGKLFRCRPGTRRRGAALSFCGQPSGAVSKCLLTKVEQTILAMIAWVLLGNHPVALPLLRFLRSAHRWAVPGLGVCGPSSQFTAKINRSNTRVFGAAGLDQRRAGVLLHSKPYRPLPGQRCQLCQRRERNRYIHQTY